MDIVPKIEAYIESLIRVTPQHTNRASEIGHQCERYLVYLRVAWEQRAKPDLGLQRIFEEGKLQERAFGQTLAAAGFVLIDAQRDFKDDATNITGSIDGVVLNPQTNESWPMEFKSCSPHVFEQLNPFDEFHFMEAMQALQGSFPWMAKYPGQIQTYLFFKGKEVAKYFFKNKTSGALREFTVKLNMDFLDALFKRAQHVNHVVGLITQDKIKATQEGKEVDYAHHPALPERWPDRDLCADCDFRQVCLPGVKLGPELKIEDNPLMEAQLAEWMKLGELVAGYDKLNEKIKNLCKGRENVIVGKYHITGKADAKGSWRKKINLIPEGEKPSA